MTKLRIDLLNGVLEVEGEESFVSKVYEDYKLRFEEANKISIPTLFQLFNHVRFF